ncbi:MAG: lipid II flippase MurJ [Kiritimatiellia bacterium]
MGITGTKLESKIFKAGLFVGIAHILFKLAGLIQARFMTEFLPKETYDVVYTFAFEHGIFTLFLIGEEALAPAFLPLFMRELDRGRLKDAWRFANSVLSIQFVLLAFASLLLFLAPQWVVSLCTAGDYSPEKFALATRSFKTLSPALIGLSLGSTTYVLLNAHKRFFLAAFGDAVWKFCAVTFLIAGVVLGKDCAQMLMWGLVGGSLCKIGTHLYGLRDKLYLFRFGFDLHHPFMKKLLWLMVPLLAGIIVAKIRDQVNDVYVLSTIEESGLMQANSLGRKLQSTVHWLVPYTLSIAVFPFFCELVDRKDQRELGRLVTHFGRMLMAAFIPFALLVAVISVPFTSFIFQGGFFDQTAVHRTALALSFYTFVLPAGAIESLTMQAFFANRRMWTVTLTGIFFSTLSIIISWIGLHLAEGNGVAMLSFIAGGFALSRILKSVTLTLFLKKNAPVFPFRDTWLFLLRVTLASVAAGAAAWFLLGQLSAPDQLCGRMGDLVKLVLTGSLFGVIYLFAAYILKITEIHELFNLIRSQVLKMLAQKRV